MHSNCRHLPEDIVCKITQKNNIRRANTYNPTLKLLNAEITSDIQKHKQNIWKELVDAHWDHRHNTHIIWKTIHGLSNRAPPATLNRSITFNSKITNTPKHIANCFTKQFTNTVKHATHKTDTLTEQHTTNKIQNLFLTAQSTQIKSVISVPIKDFIHHYPRALFNDIPRVGAYFYDIPGSGRIFTTYPGRAAV